MDKADIIIELESLSLRVQELSGKLANLTSLLRETDAEFPAWAQEKVDQRICLVCGEPVLPGDKYVRGCHESHSRRVVRAIERGEYTEKEAIEKGLMAPKSSGGRKPAPLPLDPRVQQEADEAAAKLRKRAKKKD
ncbi:MAG: hypothetical protein Aurels2KO_10670 [Aureliella sp.]